MPGEGGTLKYFAPFSCFQLDFLSLSLANSHNPTGQQIYQMLDNKCWNLAEKKGIMSLKWPANVFVKTDNGFEQKKEMTHFCSGRLVWEK